MSPENDEVTTLPGKFQWAWALLTPLILAVGYLWGIVYRDTRLSGWGLTSYSVSMSPQEVYVYAFHAGMSVLRWPTEWLDATPPWIIYGVLAPGVVLVGILGLSRIGETMVLWRDRWHTRPRQPISERRRRAAQWVFQLSAVIFFWPVVLYGSAAAVVFVVAPPLYAAKADAARGWEKADYKKWDTVLWTTSLGEKREGFVYGCTEVECAIVQGDGQAYVVPRAQLGERKGRRFQGAEIIDTAAR